MATNIKVLEEHRLSDGGRARVSIYKRKYSYSRLYTDETPPEVVYPISKSEAYKMLADTLKADVLETE